MKKLDKIQKEQAKWQLENFGDFNTNHMLLGINEEIGELCHSELKEQQGIRNYENHKANQKDAVGDILIYIMAYCSSKGWILSELLNTTWNEVVKKRNWKE